LLLTITRPTSQATSTPNLRRPIPLKAWPASTGPRTAALAALGENRQAPTRARGRHPHFRTVAERGRNRACGQNPGALVRRSARIWCSRASRFPPCPPPL
jgi:hypothetical protein